MNSVPSFYWLMYSNLRCLKTSGGSCVFLTGLCELLAVTIPDISSLFVVLLNSMCDSLWLQLLPLRVTALLTSNGIGQCYPLFCILCRWDRSSAGQWLQRELVSGEGAALPLGTPGARAGWPPRDTHQPPRVATGPTPAMCTCVPAQAMTHT